MTTAEQAYIFRHAVVRDAAYNLHLPSERSELHRLVIACIGTAVGDGAIAAELAEHAMYAQDGAAPEALERLLLAEKGYREQATR